MTSINLFNDQPIFLERQMNTFAEREVKKLINVLIQSTETSFDFSFKPKSRKMKIFGKEDKNKQGFRIKEFSEASMDALIEAIYYGNITKLKLSDKYGNSIRLSLKQQTIYLTVSREFKVDFIRTLTGLEDVFTVSSVSLDGGYTVFKSDNLNDVDKYRILDYIIPSISELRKSTDATDVLFPYETSTAQDINAFLKEFTFGFEDDILVTEYFDLSAVDTLTPMVDFTYSIQTEKTNSYYWDHFPEGTLRAFFTKDNELIRAILGQCINGESACVRIINLTTGDIGSFDENGFWLFRKPQMRIVGYDES